MFIRQVTMQNPGYDKTFVYHRLMTSVRTERGPRQRMLLNLGKLDLPQDQWKTLANRIEEIFTGQAPLFLPEPHIESLAQHYAQLLRRKEMEAIPASQVSEPEWHTVDVGSLCHSDARTIGGEALAYEFFERLDLPQVLADIGLGREEINRVALLVIGRLLKPASERKTALWARQTSAIGELVGSDFTHLSNNALYRLCDVLVEHRPEIERRLAEREKALCRLEEKIILYDLTNAYLTGRAHESRLAKHGHSKEKRSDCPLLTLALVVDEDGFPKASRVLSGSVSEPQTLAEFLRLLQVEQPPLGPRTVVIDAGIATQENLKLITREGYSYICVSRSRPQEIPTEGLAVIKQDKSSTVQAKRLSQEGEVILYCQSSARQRKEEAMKASFVKHFEAGLAAISASLAKKQGRKGYARIMERLGRLKERYPSIARFYSIDVEHQDGVVKKISWALDDKAQARFSGSYYIRSDRADLSDEKLWSLYVMLTRVEEAFRCLKSDLGLRPMYHRKDRRLEGHIFISVLAYHLLVAIQRELKKKGIAHRWDTIRDGMASQVRITASLTTDKGERLHLRQTTDPEPFHTQIHRAVGIPVKPLKTKRLQK